MLQHKDSSVAQPGAQVLLLLAVTLNAHTTCRCLAVGLFFFFIFVLVPGLGHHCNSTAGHGKLESLDDLQAFLLLLAEEQAHDAEKHKHLLALAQQIGSTGSHNVSTTSQSQQLLQKTQADLAASKKVIKRHEELLQQQLQEAAQLRTQLQQQPHGAGGIPTTTSAPQDVTSCQAGAMRALSIAGDSCGALPGVELGGDVVIWGAEHKTASAAECCAACHAHSRGVFARGVGSEAGKKGKACNVWVHCSNADACGARHQECWLKHDTAAAQSAAAAAAAAAASSSSGGAPQAMWTSGVPAAGQPAAAWEAARLGVPAAAAAGAVESEGGPAAVQFSGAAPQLVWSTALGQIRVQLLPDLAPSSVRELLRMGLLLSTSSSGSSSSGHCSNCRIYRAERGFLVQGVVETPGAYVAVPRHPNPPQRKVMQRGLMCWAGGGGGPDWFVNMIDQSGFADQHLCFGQVDQAGLAVFESILSLPVKPKGGADSVEMVLLQQDVRFNFTLAPSTASKGLL